MEGTHRVIPPAQTLERITPLFVCVGITRLADLTALDCIGIPVFQAVRPSSRNLSVSQGKGQTVEAAQVSAAMEAIELWHAEIPEGEVRRATAREVRDELGYDARTLALADLNCFHDQLVLEWLEATSLDSQRSTLVPRELVTLDSRVERIGWRLPVFRASSNGLASGNTREEAALHGICEVLERDAIWQHHIADGGTRWLEAKLDLATVTDPPCCEAIEALERAGMRTFACDLTDSVGVPCFDAMILSEDFASTFGGHGCHPDAGVALSRALTEAVQSRLTTIAGSRDDMTARTYSGARSFSSDILPAAIEKAAPAVSFGEVASVATDDVVADLQEVTSIVRRMTGVDPVFVEHTRAGLGVPVVHVVAPGLRFGGHR